MGSAPGERAQKACQQVEEEPPGDQVSRVRAPVLDFESKESVLEHLPTHFANR